MKLDSSKTDFIYKAFHDMKSKEDFLILLNFAKKEIYGEQALPIEMRNLNYYISSGSKQNRYTKFTIKKKSGEDRIIHSPVTGLKVIQKCINLIFQSTYKANPAATGFVVGKSIVDNAKIHSGKNYVLNLDLKDFFSSIDQARVWGRLQAPPFNLNEQNGRLKLANIIACLCCHEMIVDRLDSTNRWIKTVKNVVPQGAPTSPALINIICQRLDYYLSAVAKRFSVNYTRYADDITFSSDHNVYQKNGDFITEVERIIKDQNFSIKDTKTHLQKSGYRQQVTGLVVNHRPNVHGRYIKQIRHWLYAWEKHGFDYASNFFLEPYLKDKINPKTKIPDINNVLHGKLNYLKMVKGFDNPVYLKLNERFERLLISVTDKNDSDRSNQTVSDSLETEKIDKIEIPFYHEPRALVKILHKFTLNNTALKYSTHNWDAGQDENIFRDLPDFIKKANKEFYPVSEHLKILKYELYAKITSFLFFEKVAEKGWGTHRIKFGWSSPELLAGMSNDPNLKPENFILPEKAQFLLSKNSSEETIQKFKQVIDIFKNEIEIRDENSVLEELLIDKHDTYLKGFKIKYITNLVNTNFFTDVDYFNKALNLVFENIQKRPEHREVSYIIKDESEYYILEIIHHGSTAKGKSFKHKKLSLQSGDFGTLKTLLFNLCDWSIETQFKEGPARINFLISNQNTPAFEKIDHAEDFKYIFKFYK